MKTTEQTPNHRWWVPGWIARLAASRSTHFWNMSDSVENILSYLRDAAGFAIDIKPNVPIERSRRRPGGPLENEEQALLLLKQAMGAIGCTVLRKGRLLKIITVQEAKKHWLPLPTIGRGGPIGQRTV